MVLFYKDMWVWIIVRYLLLYVILQSNSVYLIYNNIYKVYLKEEERKNKQKRKGIK